MPDTHSEQVCQNRTNLIDTHRTKPIEITETVGFVFDLLADNIVWRAINPDELSYSKARIDFYFFPMIFAGTGVVAVVL